MYKKNFTIAFFILSLITFSYAIVDTASKVDTTFFLTVDLTADDTCDTIFCHLTGESWKKPFMATFKIKSKDTIIFSVTYNDEIYDEEFGSNNIDWCDKEYLVCKEKWYFEMMWKEMIKTVKLKDKRRKRLFDTTSNTSIPQVIEKLYIDSLGYSKDKAAAESKKLTAILKKRDFSCLVLPLHPVYPSFPKLYDPISNKFIMLFGY